MGILLFLKTLGWIYLVYLLIGDAISIVEIIRDGIKYHWDFSKVPEDEVYGKSYITLTFIWPVVIIDRLEKKYGKTKN